MIEIDNEVLQDILDSFHELYASIENDLDQLSKSPSDARFNSLFRAIHNIKGHASLAQLNALVDYTHALEDVAERLRSKTLTPSDKLCECLLLGMDRLRDLHYRDILKKNYPDLNEQDSQALFHKIANIEFDPSLESTLDQLLSVLSGGYHSEASTPSQTNTVAKDTKPNFNPPPNDRQYLDLAFFQELSFQVDSTNPCRVGRSIQLYDWAQKLNHLTTQKVDYQQLAAAIYMHDIGMSFVRQDIANKQTPLSSEEQQELQRHVGWGYDVLVRMQGWEEAALAVLCHHERIDGTGYPNQIKGDLIHPGGKILAILDTFFSLITTEANKSQRKSVLRAMSEINARKGTQFDEELVDLFNLVIKSEVQQGRL